MTAHIAIRPNSTTQLPQRGGSHAKDIEPAWLSRLLTRKSRKSQYLSVLDLETASIYHATEPILSPTTDILSEDTTGNNKLDTSNPRPSAPMTIPGSRNDKTMTKTKTKYKHRFSFTPRREEATPPVAKPADNTNTQARRKSSGAAYVPKHAASDFGQVAVPTTYRDSFVFLYSSSSSSDHHQHRRSSRVGSNSAKAMVEYQRRHSSAISNLPALNSSTASLDTAPASANTWSRRGSNVFERQPSTNNRLSRQSLVFMMTEENDGCDDFAMMHVNDDIKGEEENDNLIVPLEETNRKTKLNSTLTVPVIPSVNDDMKTTSTRSKRHSTLGHNLQVSPPTIVLSSSASSITSKRAQRGSFSQARRMSRRQTAGGEIQSEAQEPKKGRRDSVIVSLGKRVSEYIKPTMMPDNETTVLPQISVSRSGLL